MQPYPRAPDLVWPGHLHDTSCLSAWAMDTGFSTVVWHSCLGLGCAWAWVSVTPPTLAGVWGGYVWVPFVVLPLLSRPGFVVYAVGPGFWLAPHHSWQGFWGVLRCVRAPPVPHRSRLGCAVWVCVLGLGFALRPATPGWGVGVCVCLCACSAWSPAPPGWGCGAALCAWAWVAAVPRNSWLGSWGVCVFVCAPRWYPATPGWGVRCGRVCFGSGFACALPLLAGVLGCVCSCVCPVCTPPFLAGCCVCVWVGVLSALRFFRGLGAGARGLWCVSRPFPVSFWEDRLWRRGVRWVGVVPPPFPFCFLSWLCGVCCWLSRFWVSWSPSSFPTSFGLCLRVCFVFPCPPLPQRGVCRRVQSVLSFGGTLLLVGCRRLWLGRPWVFFRKTPWLLSSVPSGWGVCPPLVVWVGGFVAVGLSRAPPPLFLGGGSACSSLCLPWAGARTGRLSVWLTGLVFAFRWTLPRPYGSGGFCTHLARWLFLSG